MDMFATISEQKIREAMARGEFDHLPGRGKPLAKEDLTGVPEELRMAYKIMENGGFMPPEVDLTREIATLKNLVGAIEEDELRRTRIRELNYKLLKLNVMRRRPFDLDDFPEYRVPLLERLAG
jgi:hypothetical protein